MIRRGFIVLALVLFGLVFVRLVGAYHEQNGLRSLADYYVTHGPADLGAPNVITGILITYRGFDTLGEVAVLFMVAASIGLLLHQGDGGRRPMGEKDARRPPSELIGTGAGVLLPLIFLFGAYVIMHGHLSAGGGFQGGAIVASGTMLLVMAQADVRLPHGFLSVTESLAGVLYVFTGILGLILAGGFLDSRFLPNGTFGTLISAGAIPVISMLLGIKVGAELSVIIDRFRS